MNLLGHLVQTKSRLDALTKLTRYRKQTIDPMQTQWSFLKQLLQHHADTEFGRQYSFKTISSIKDFQARVPIHTWEAIYPYVNQVMNGHQEALFPRNEKLIMYAVTSGTTAQPKFIPITNTAYRRWGYYWDHYWAYAMRLTTTCLRKALYFPSTCDDGYINGVPYGAITAKAYAQQNWLIRKLYPYPYQIALIEDYDIRYYTIMRLALEHDITVAAVANPSTVLALFKNAQTNAQSIIADIFEGRLRYENQMPSQVRELLKRQIKPHKARAHHLESIASHNGDFTPNHYWPNFQGLCCFAAGPLKIYFKLIKNFVNSLRVIDFGILASEGRLTFGIGEIHSHPGCCPTLESNFFEFIPEDEIDRTNPTLLTLDQLEIGKRYFVILTNYSGLYRYNIFDLLQVTGFMNSTPLLTFCNKGKHMSNITGEKLSEFQVTESVRLAAHELSYDLHDFVVCLAWDGDMPYYSLLKDATHSDNPDSLSTLATHIERQLMMLNDEYKRKRESLRLGPLCIKPVMANAYQNYRQQKMRNCTSIAQYKPTFLISDQNFEKQFHFSYSAPSTI